MFGNDDWAGKLEDTTLTSDPMLMPILVFRMATANATQIEG